MKPSPAHPTILVATLAPEMPLTRQEGVEVVQSALACLNMATSRRFDWIVICQTANDPPIRRDLIELVDCLRHHRASRSLPVLVVLDDWHRNLIVDLQAAGLEHLEVRCVRQSLDPLEVCELARRYPGRFDIRRILSRLCPFLSYPVFDGRKELIACGACRNRMVLGGDRLRSVCRTSDHRSCAWFYAVEAKR